MSYHSSPKLSNNEHRGRLTVRIAEPRASAAAAIMLIAALLAPRADAQSGAMAREATPAVPAWLYPSTPAAGPSEADTGQPLRLPDSHAAFTRTQLGDRFSAPDWHPDSHGPMPAIVAHGRPPAVLACGYCHTPTGQGRPENAALAGLPAAYIREQVEAFGSGVRRAAWPAAYGPADLMIQSATQMHADELALAADYFAHQTLRPRVRVIESTSVPRWQVIGQVYAAIAGAGSEPLGQRLMEFSPDPKRHEMRDDRMQYLAYAPPGSIERGNRLVHQGPGGAATACVSCHGPQLRGVELVPPLAGRSPTYLLRALFAFRTGARAGPSTAPMQPVVQALATASMIDAVAYASSLPP